MLQYLLMFVKIVFIWSAFCALIFFDVVECEIFVPYSNWVPSNQFSNSSAITWSTLHNSTKLKFTSSKNFRKNNTANVNQTHNEFILANHNDYINQSLLTERNFDFNYLYSSHFKMPNSTYIYPNNYNMSSRWSPFLFNYPNFFHSDVTNFPLNSYGETLINPKDSLFVQVGRCSNSIEIERSRKIRIKSVNVHETDKAVCILMLYSLYEKNKLALSLQILHDKLSSHSSIMNHVLSNLKLYSVAEGIIKSVSFTNTLESHSPALILTKGTVVLLSVIVDRYTDFTLDISTYSLSC